jgi:signal peptidase II
MTDVEQREATAGPILDVRQAPRRSGLPFWLGGGIVTLDQATKALVRWKLDLHDSVTILPGVLDITHVQNTGAAFGILNATDLPYKPALMLVVALAAFVAIAYYASRLGAQEMLARTGLTLVLAGAVGNLIDRAVAGFVTDFVDVYWRGWHFWAFNVSDAAITVGAGLVILDLLLAGRHAPRTI